MKQFVDIIEGSGGVADPRLYLFCVPEVLGVSSAYDRVRLHMSDFALE
jgi:hypothetical protein